MERFERFRFSVLAVPLRKGLLCVSVQFSTSGLKKTWPFRFLLLKTVVLDWFMVGSCLFSVFVHLPNFGSQCEEPCENYKFKSDILEAPVILMPEHREDGSGFGSWKRFRRFRFRVRFLGKRFRRFWFLVPVRFLGHPD